jgi:hypothetical protein
MAVATISVNFATQSDITNGVSTVASVNPLQLKNALQSGSLMYSLNVAALTTNGNLTINGSAAATGDVTAFSSDSRLKTVISIIPDALEKVNKVSGVLYKHNEIAKQYGFTENDVKVGVLAQEVQAVLPEVIKPAPFDVDENGTSKSGQNYLTVQYEKIVPLLIEAIKELSKKVEALEQKRGE